MAAKSSGTGRKRGINQVIKIGSRKVNKNGKEEEINLFARVGASTVKFFGLEPEKNPTIKRKGKDGQEREVLWAGRKGVGSVYAVVTEGEGETMKIKTRKAIPFPSGCDEATMIEFLKGLKENTPTHYINRAGRMMQLPSNK